MQASDWRSLIAETVEEIWPDLPAGSRWIESQVHVESHGNPTIISPSGAVGLLQLMPGTAKELGVTDWTDPRQNLSGGVRYLKKQYGRISVIQGSNIDRLLWSFAAYNCGYGYVNEAIILSERDAEPMWQTWQVGRYYLMHRDCKFHGRWPDYRQVWNYVRRILKEFGKL